MRRLRVRNPVSSRHRLRLLSSISACASRIAASTAGGVDLLAALQPVVEAGQRETRHLGRRGRTGDRQAVAARDQRDAELALDAVEMLVALAVEHRQQQIVLEFELRCARRRRYPPRSAAAALMPGAPLRSTADRRASRGRDGRSAGAIVPARLLGSAASIRTGTISPIRSAAASACTALQIGAAADELAVMPSRLLEQHRQHPADAGGVEGALLLLQQSLQFGEPLGLDRLRHLVRLARGRGAGARRIFEREGLREADLAHEIERVPEIRRRSRRDSRR